MIVEQQYIDLFSQTESMICKHSAEVLNAPRAAAFADFERLGFPTRKMEKYKYTDVSKYFEPDYGLNLNRLAIPVNPYEVFKCDVPNMSTALYFVVNDAFYNRALPKVNLPEGVIFGSLKEVAGQHPELVKKYYGQAGRYFQRWGDCFQYSFCARRRCILCAEECSGGKTDPVGKYPACRCQLHGEPPRTDYPGGWRASSSADL